MALSRACPVAFVFHQRMPGLRGGRPMRDQYIGIDLHQAFFQACAVTPDGARLWEGRFPRTVPGLAALTARGTPASAVAVDASTATWHFADAVVTAVGELRIVDPWKTTRKAGYAAKTDRLHARGPPPARRPCAAPRRCRRHLLSAARASRTARAVPAPAGDRAMSHRRDQSAARRA